MFGNLTEFEARCICDVDCDGLRCHEAAERLGVTKRAVHLAVRRARKKLLAKGHRARRLRHQACGTIATMPTEDIDRLTTDRVVAVW